MTFQKEIIDKYKLRDKVTPNGFVYIIATKGMYGLPQAGLITNRQQTPRKTPQQTRVPAKQTDTRTMETLHKADTVHIGCRQLWR